MDGYPITVTGLTKHFGSVSAVEDLSFTAEPGRVTGFLGPNGAGKSTTLRALVGLVSPTSGDARIGGERYANLKRPATVVGTQFEPAFHPGRTARDHLRVYAPLVAATDATCDEALARVGIAEAAGRRVGEFSLGMRQRLGLATALLGQPRVLLLDESANGLDPAGVRWLREFVRAFASDGGTVLLSSHLLSEVEQTVDDVVIIARGRLRHASTLDDLRRMAEPGATLRSPNAAALDALVSRRWPHAVHACHDGVATVSGITAAEAGSAAFADGVELHGLEPVGESLESLFLRLTADEEVAA